MVAAEIARGDTEGWGNWVSRLDGCDVGAAACEDADFPCLGAGSRGGGDEGVFAGIAAAFDENAAADIGGVGEKLAFAGAVGAKDPDQGMVVRVGSLAGDDCRSVWHVAEIAIINFVTDREIEVEFGVHACDGHGGTSLGDFPAQAFVGGWANGAFGVGHPLVGNVQAFVLQGGREYVGRTGDPDLRLDDEADHCLACDFRIEDEEQGYLGAGVGGQVDTVFERFGFLLALSVNFGVVDSDGEDGCR